MIPAKFEFSIDEKFIEKEVRKQVDQVTYSQYWFIDMNKMSELTSMSRRWLEEVVVCDPRMKQIEIKKKQKRLWPYEKALEVITELLNEN